MTRWAAYAARWVRTREKGGRLIGRISLLIPRAEPEGKGTFSLGVHRFS